MWRERERERETRTEIKIYNIIMELKAVRAH